MAQLQSMRAAPAGSGGQGARRATALTAACLAALALLPWGAPGALARSWSRGPRPLHAATSAELGYEFLYRMMDRYASGSRPRLVQSFAGGKLEKRHFTDSLTYDDALIIDALVVRGTAEDVARAKLIGEALLYVQANDPSHDGRIRAAYAPAPLTSPAAVQATDATSDVGNVAWVGQAFVQLYARTADSAFLSAAKSAGEWIQVNAYDTRGAGGYTGGIEENGSRIKWKSTEHNVDVFSFFELLATQTGEAVWRTRAQWARGFVASMWNPMGGFFYVGSGEDGVSVNAEVFAEDVNSWSYLALQNAEWAASLDWERAHLSVNRRGFAGVSFCTRDRRGVWFEGTAHLADALERRDAPGDASLASSYLADIARAQSGGKHTDGQGIIAASKDGLSTCEGEHYFASLHTGATSWYLLALAHADPFTPLA
jgi:hypothetical protein